MSDQLGSGGIVPVAIYTRVSTENQVGGRFDSCESQLAVCREHVRKHAEAGWVEVAHFSDPAFSGSTMDRPGLRALLAQIEAGGVRAVVIFKLERMSRNIDEWGPFRNFLKRHNCRLESATEDISETTPSGRLKNNLMLSFSQYERENTAEKTKVKMVQQAARGYWNGGALPYGYAYDKNTQSLQPDPAEAPVVRRIFERAANLVPLEQLADELNQEGLRTRVRVHKRLDGSQHTVGGIRFRSDGLRLLITNPIYRGVIRYAGKEQSGRHTALVTDDVWEMANASIKTTIRPTQTLRVDQDKHFHLLKGLVHCGCCQRALVPHASGSRDERGRLYRYYYCSHLVKERADSQCSVRRLAAGSLENVVVRFLGELGKHPDVVGAAVGSSQAHRQIDRDRVTKSIAKIDREMKETNQGIRNCVDAIAGGGKDIAEELTGEIARLKDRKQEQMIEWQRLTQELATCENEVLDASRVNKSIERFGEILSALAPDEQKTLVGLLVDRIVVRPVQDDAPSSAPASVRHLELEFKLNLPRLVDGMAQRGFRQAGGKRLVMRGVHLTAEVALGQQGRSNQAAIISPFRSGEVPKPELVAQASRTTTVDHPIVRAIRWQRMLDDDPTLSLRKLAEREGEVAPTLVHYLKLLKLAPEIQRFLRGLTEPRAVQFFSVRRMMAMADLSQDQQRKGFRQLTAEFAPQPNEKIEPRSAREVAPNPRRGMRI